jgi:predicted amidohydrolase
MSEESRSKSIKASAIQIEARVAEVARNIEHTEKLACEAGNAGAKIIALPEFFTTPIVYDERIYSCSLPPTNPAADMIQRVARRYHALVGGSYLELRDGDVYNTYVLSEPDGTLHRHDKDLPTMVENSFYIGGSDDGLFSTSMGDVGVAVCWETVRTQTVHRLRGKVGLLMTGSHWWSEPGWSWGRKLWDKFHEANGRLMKRTPGTFAKLVGAPSLHAAHTGVLKGRFLVGPFAGMSVGTRTQLMGEAQVVDADGTILARRTYLEGPGLATAHITPGTRPTSEPVPDGFWIPNLDALSKVNWYHQNHCGKKAYRRAKRRGAIIPAEIP